MARSLSCQSWEPGSPPNWPKPPRSPCLKPTQQRRKKPDSRLQNGSRIYHRRTSQSHSSISWQKVRNLPWRRNQTNRRREASKSALKRPSSRSAARIMSACIRQRPTQDHQLNCLKTSRTCRLIKRQPRTEPLNLHSRPLWNESKLLSKTIRNMMLIFVLGEFWMRV